jgi:undecaprenyl-diphosphatase
MTSGEAVGAVPARQHSEERVATGTLSAIAAIGVAGFLLLTWLVATRTPIPFDAPLRDIALGWSRYKEAWSFLSDAANLPLIAIGIGIVAWLLVKRRFRDAIVVVGILVAVTAGSEAVKQLVHRPRPPASDARVIGVVYSFPSGHVLESLTILGTIAVLVWRTSLPAAVRVGVAIAVAVFVVLVAVARVAIDAHYPSDVLAGFLGGMAALAVFVLLTRPRAAPAHPPARSRT